MKDLQGQLIVKQVVTEKVAVPVTATTCQDINLGPFRQKVCAPQVRMEQRDIQKTVNVEDPNIRRELDATLANLNSLSGAAKETQKAALDFEPFYDFVQKMIKPLISLLVFGASLFIIISKNYKAVSEKWAFGSLGTVIGIWLK